RPCGRRKEQRLAGKRYARAFDQDAQPGRGVTERVHDPSPIHAIHRDEPPSMTPDPSPFMGRAREGPGCPSKAVHILDDPMSDYGDHESTDDPLQKLRHSTAHLLAAAVTELHPDAKYGIGPPVQDGFYYDFDFGKPISESDLQAIESRMRRLAQA